MPNLLRRLTNKDAWAAVEESPLWEQNDCPHEALVQIFDTRGVSTWRVHTDDEIERVIAAQAFGRSTIGDFAYCLIDEDVLRRENIKTKDTPTRTIDSEMEKRHVDIIELSGQKLIRLAHLINSELEIRVMTRAEILTAGCRYFNTGIFDRHFLFSGKRNEIETMTAKNLLVNLWKKAEIDLQGEI
jgi:hypothetical protein